MEKKLDGGYTRMLGAILNKSKRQHPTKQQLYGHLPPITKTIKIRRTRHTGHCWRSRDKLISDVLQWTPFYGRTKTGRPSRTNIQQLCADTGCSPDDLPKAMDDREAWRERVKNICADSATWWWWWLAKNRLYFQYVNLYICVCVFLCVGSAKSWWIVNDNATYENCPSIFGSSNIYIYIYIYKFKSCSQHGFDSLSLSVPIGHRNRQCLHICWSANNVCMSLLREQWSECLVRLIWMVSAMRGKWPYNCWFQDSNR